MSSRPSTTDSSGQEAASGGSFATLGPARYLLLTTFKPEGTPMAVPVRVVIDGDRAYFGARAASGTSKRLRRTDWVQVVRSAPLGMASFGPRTGATARLLAGEEARQAAERLARTRPAWREFAGSLARRVTRQQTLYFELRPHDPAAGAAGAAQADGATAGPPGASTADADAATAGPPGASTADADAATAGPPAAGAAEAGTGAPGAGAAEAGTVRAVTTRGPQPGGAPRPSPDGAPGGRRPPVPLR